MAMKFHSNVRGEVRVNFLALSASKPHIFMRAALILFRIVCANVRLNFRHSKSFLAPDESPLSPSLYRFIALSTHTLF